MWKSRINQQIKFPRDTKWRMHQISINYGWNTYIDQLLHEKRDGNLFSK